MTLPLTSRPRPSDDVLEVDIYGKFEPAPELLAWVHANILDDEGVVHNPEHIHLLQADIGFLWTTSPCTMKGKMVAGMAEIPMFRCNQWQKARQEIQIREWFGGIPDFIITLDAIYCDQCTDMEFLALLEHELYHCGQAKDAFGAPKFNRDTGRPVFTMRGHDVEEFVGVVRRYGITSEELGDMVIAAARPAEVSNVSIAHACGTCLVKSA